MFFKLTKKDIILILNYLGLLIKWSSYSFLIPIIIIFIYNEPKLHLIIYLFLWFVIFLFGDLLQTTNKRDKTTIFTITHAIIITALFWIIFNLLASFPFMLIEHR